MANLEGWLDAAVRDAQANAPAPPPQVDCRCRGQWVDCPSRGAGRFFDAGYAPMGEGLTHRLDSAGTVPAHRTR
jgi:hypothetical protein